LQGESIVSQKVNTLSPREKRLWVSPKFQRLEAGAAESQAGAAADGGGGAQGS
jgi:hypothetical protein